MKTAILLVGNVRTWQQCKQNFEQTFSGLSADVFVSTYDLQYAYHPWIKQSLNFHEDVYLDRDAIQAHFSGMNLKGITIDAIDTYVDQKVKPFISSKYPNDAYLSLSQYFKLSDGLKMIEIEEQRSGKQYDVVIKSRMDITYNPVQNLDVSNNVYIDGSGAGVFPCDWVFITNRRNTFAISRFIDEEMRDMKHESSLVDMPHKLFLNGINSTGSNLVPVPIVKDIIRAKA